MKKITPFLWFDNQAEQAAQFYVNIFSKRKGTRKKSKIKEVVRYDSEDAAARIGRKPGSVMCVNFMLDGEEFTGLNGGPRFNFTEAISFVINCKTQEEVDYFWKKLGQGGQHSRCGWLQDKYGLWWQVVPIVLNKWILDKNAIRANHVMNAMLQMDKIVIKTLREAYDNKQMF